MPSKEDLLQQLSVKKLRELAKDNRVLLIYEGWLGGTHKATTKEDIVAVLLKSRKVSKKKVEDKVFDTPRRKTSTRGKSVKQKRKTRSKAERTMILKSQNYRCALCKKDVSKITPHYDHRIPLAIGGSDTITNIQALCGTCHTEKTQKDILEISRARGR